MAKFFWLLLSFAICSHYGRSHPLLNEEVGDNFDSDDEIWGGVESAEDDEADALVGYETAANRGSKADIQDESDEYNYSSAMKLKKDVKKAVDKILKKVDQFNKKSKKKPLTLETVDPKLGKKDSKILKELKLATRKKMIKKNEETYKAMIKIGKIIDKMAKRKGVKIPKVKPLQH